MIGIPRFGVTNLGILLKGGKIGPTLTRQMAPETFRRFPLCSRLESAHLVTRENRRLREEVIRLEMTVTSLLKQPAQHFLASCS
jgi:hypothetical protein